MIKTFVFVVYVLTSGGETVIYHSESGLNAETCASYLTITPIVGAPAPEKAFKAGRKIAKIFVACEEETGA
jgi:hypothetical protein